MSPPAGAAPPNSRLTLSKPGPAFSIKNRVVEVVPLYPPVPGGETPMAPLVKLRGGGAAFAELAGTGRPRAPSQDGEGLPGTRPRRPPCGATCERIASGVLGWGCLGCKLNARETTSPAFRRYTRAAVGAPPSPLWAHVEIDLAGWLFPELHVRPWGLGQNIRPWALGLWPRTSTTAAGRDPTPVSQ